MRLVLLGAAGQLGSDLIRAIEAGSEGTFEATAIDRNRLDVADLPAIRAILSDLQFDLLVNCTGYHKTDEVETDTDRAFLVNAQAVREMAAVCRDRAARFVHISTDYVFSGVGRDHPYAEDDCVGPLNVYGASKVMGEALALREHDDVVILRVASLFGVAGARGKGGNFVETMLRIARETGQLRVVDDIVMSPSSTADIARMLLSLVRQGADPGVYHAVNSGQASWCAFAREIVARSGVAAEVEAVTSDAHPTTAVRPAYSVLDNAKLGRAIGEIPHWQDALDRYLRAKGHTA